MIVLKIILLQTFWFTAIKYGENYNYLVFLLSFLLLGLNYFFFKPRMNLKHYGLFVLGFTLYGALEPLIFQKLTIAEYGNASFPLWFTSLFVIFLCYYGDIFNKFQGLHFALLSLVGGVAGVFAYYSGSKFSNFAGLNDWFYPSIFISWGLFFPVSIKLFYKFLNEESHA